MQKKATVFQFTRPMGMAVNLNELGAKLSQVPGIDCGETEQERRGFVPVISGEEEMVERIGDYAFICLRICEKKVSKAGVKREVVKQCKTFELNHGRKPQKAEKAEMQEQILLKILPHTPQVDRYIIGGFDLKSNRLIVSEAATKAEAFASDVRKALGSLPVRTLATETAPEFVFSQMINEELEIADVAIGDSCDLRGAEKEAANFRKSDLHSDEVKAHLKMGLAPTKIQLYFSDTSSATIDDRLSISSLKLTESALEQQGYDDIDDPVAKGRADLLLWASAVSDIMDYLDSGMTFATDEEKQVA